jgi:chondroitin-sulfate-ABC endolyase/exolyase
MPDNVLPRAGWDWSLWPGATTIYLLPEVLSSNLQMPKNGEQFVGGSHLDARHGVYAMRFHDRTFESTFWFTKSMFAFGNTVVCLGSDIENYDHQHETVTTLFQTALPERSVPIRVNSLEPVQAFPFQQTLESDGLVWLMDPAGLGYVIAGGNRVEVARRTQLSVNDMGTQEVAGDFATAWISHGKFPLLGGYEYTVILDASPEEVAAYAAAPKHEVLSRSRHAHIVRNAELGLTGYAMFRREPYLPSGPVLGVDRPCLILVEEAGENLRISVCDPDLSPRPVAHMGAHGTSDGEEAANAVEVVLRGKWDFTTETASESVKRTDLRPDTSTFAFEIVAGIPTETLLKVRP